MEIKTFLGKGYAKEASIAVINFCFTKLSLRKINLGVIANNAMALSLYRSLGFIEEGRFKKHELINGNIMKTSSGWHCLEINIINNTFNKVKSITLNYSIRAV